MAEIQSEDIKTAVGVRPHYPPCDHPDNPCSCGAFEDRKRISQALADLREATIERWRPRPLVPVPMTIQEVLDLLTGMGEHIRIGDSYGGSIEYDCLSGPPCVACRGESRDPSTGQSCPTCEGTGDESLPEGKDFWVRGIYRIGNREGQGGMRMIGTVQT